MSINLQMPDIAELKPRIIVFGVGGAGSNAVNNMIEAGLQGCDFVVANTDAQALNSSQAERKIQMGVQVTEGLGAGSQPDVGAKAAEEALDEIRDHLSNAHMAFITAGMGGGTGTGAAPIIAKAAQELGILTVGVVTKPFEFEGKRRMSSSEDGIKQLQEHVDTLIVIPNQNLFRIATESTTFTDAFSMADQVLHSGVACITDLMVKEGLINLDFADVRAVMHGMGKAMMGTGDASGEGRAKKAAEEAIANPLLDVTSMQGSKGLLISITGGSDLTLFEVDEAASRIREEVDAEANVIFGATFDDSLDGTIRVSVVATGIDGSSNMELGQDNHWQKATGKYNFNRQKQSNDDEVYPIEISEPIVELPSEQAVNSQNEEINVVHFLENELPESNEMTTVQDHRKLPSFNEIEESIPHDLRTPLDDLNNHEKELEGFASDENVLKTSEETISEKASQLPNLEEFPPIAQKEIQAKSSQSTRNQGQQNQQPFGLLQRLANGMGLNENVAVEEQPVKHTEQKRDRKDLAAKSMEDSHRGDFDNLGRSIPKSKTNMQDQELEIPAFLRRHNKTGISR